jgi:hypothetical protein
VNPLKRTSWEFDGVLRAAKMLAEDVASSRFATRQGECEFFLKLCAAFVDIDPLALLG